MTALTLPAACDLICSRVASSQWRRRYVRIATMADPGAALRAYQLSLLRVLADGEFSAEEHKALIAVADAARRDQRVPILFTEAELDRIDRDRGGVSRSEHIRRRVFGDGE